MRVTDLHKAVAERWPNAWQSDKQAAAWLKDFERVLGPFEGPQLAAAWQRVMETWKSGTWPKPAAFHEAVKAANHGEHSASPGSDAWVARSAKRASDLTERKREIIADWFERNPDLASQAKAEDWMLALRDWIKEAANIMAQRDASKAAGRDVGPIGDRWPWLRDGAYGDEIVSPPAEKIDMWREAARLRNEVPRGNLGTVRRQEVA